MVTVDESLVKRGGLAGAVTFLLGLGAAIVLASPSGSDTVFKLSAMGQSQDVTYSSLSGQGTSQPESWKVAGWVFHEAHFASIDASLSGTGGALNASFAMDPSILLRIVPVVLLVGAGFVLAHRANAAEPLDAAKQGAHVVVGYALLALVSVFLLSWETSSGGSSFTAEPDLVTGVLLTGIVVPGVLGALGGFLNYTFGDDLL